MWRVLWLFVLSLIMLTIGLGGGYMIENASDLIIFPLGASVFLIVLAVFSFSFLFFGFPSPLIMLFLGIYTGWVFKSIPGSGLMAGVLLVSSVLSSYSSISLGNAILDDMRGIGNFKKALKISLIILLVALVLAGGYDLAVPSI